MPNKIDMYIFKNFMFIFLIVFALVTMLTFSADLIEQFRKSTNKDVPVSIVFQLASLNLTFLIFSTLPITIFFSTIFCILKLTRNSEYIVIGSSGISFIQFIKTPIICFFLITIIFVMFLSPLSSIFQKKFQELDYKYIKRMDRYTAITQNGIWLIQENNSGISNIIYAKKIENNGAILKNFMLLEYHDSIYKGRIDGL